MKILSSVRFVCFVAVLGVTACAWEPEPEEEEADTSFFAALEGAEVIDGLDDSMSSAVFEAPHEFERLGLLWDAGDDSALEVRMSVDGATWSEWMQPEVGFAEEGVYAGFIDAPEPMRYAQYRVVDMEAAPTFVSFDAIAEVPIVRDVEVEPGGEVASTRQELRTPIGRVRVHSRRSWGARRPRCRAFHAPRRATIHHTVTPTNDPYSPKRRLRQIQAYHMFSRGYCDIAYNYLVSRDGRIWRGRGARRIGGHVYNNNTGNVGIAFLGNYMRTRARFRQRCNTAKLLAGLHRRFPRLRLNRRRIKGHRQYGAAGGYTSCPGDRLYRQIRNIVRMSRRGCD